MEHWELLFFFFGIALLYASVGFGGGSSYLAILALYGIDYRLLRAAALLCNIIVVTGGVYIFYRNGHLKLKKVVPLVVVSVPLAFVGGSLRIAETTFFIILGLVLLLAAILMWIQTERTANETRLAAATENRLTNAGLGGGIGFLAGLVGIGGGIFLSPLLHLRRWDTSQVIAATASAFILVNSVAGLLGQFSQTGIRWDWPFMLLLMGSVFIGGQIGSRLGAHRFSARLVRRMTAILIIFVSVRILYKYLPLWLS